MADEVTLLNTRPSLFGIRVKIALAEKGIEYVHKEENLQDKSPLLLKMNPIHKKIPVLIHNGKPICESLVIFQYIDEVYDSGRRAVMTTDGKELIESLKLLEGELGEKPYFGGEKFGYLDLSFIPFYTLFNSFDTYGNVAAKKPR
ncbi:probable glutathione S-transferase [Macadamia integrifolia]|uniref:probable glutathione S-transferase n=1 Tax=Macadamia integrifolia TaxID=60698 RepID=UPI001C4F09D3|nr:probable glutathione S-transferase [Macadamia integrifolia]